MSDSSALAHKREANIKEREEKRAAKMAELKQKKELMAKERADAALRQKKELEEAETRAHELNKRRNEKIQERERLRREKAEQMALQKKSAGSRTSKYAKKDIVLLKKIFDDYDVDEKGTIDPEEFHKALERQKPKLSVTKSHNLEERKAASSIGIFDVNSSVFSSIDQNNDNNISFKELLTVIYKFASEEEINLMLEWVAPEPEPEPEPEPGLSADQIKEITEIFKIYDKDKSGEINKKELSEALRSTGLEKDDIMQIFNEYDKDGNDNIDLNEFIQMMGDPHSSL